MAQKILRTSAAFTLLSIMASGLNFLYYPIIARSLSYAQFGEVQVGIAFIMQAAALFTSLNILALFFTAQKGDRSHLAIRLERFVIAVSLLLAFFAAIFAIPIAHALQLNDHKFLYILSVIFLLNIPAATWIGAIQGNGQFIGSGLVSVLSALSKILASLALIWMGTGAYGALFGILIGAAVILPLSYLIQKDKVISARNTFSVLQWQDLSLIREHPRVMIVFVSLFFLAIASTVDVVFSKSSLDPTAAGIYAQLSTVAKIPYFAATPLAILMFERFIRNPRQTKQLIGVFCVFVALAAVATLVLQQPLITLFFAIESYNATTFALLCATFSAYAVTTLLLYGLLSRKMVWRTAAVSISSIVLPIILLSTTPKTQENIAQQFAISQLITLSLAVGLQYTKSYEQ